MVFLVLEAQNPNNPIQATKERSVGLRIRLRGGVSETRHYLKIEGYRLLLGLFLFSHIPTLRQSKFHYISNVVFIPLRCHCKGQTIFAG